MERQHYRSLFWPILLIGVGVIWLLGNLNIIQTSALSALWSFWPLLLVLAGIDLLFGRTWPWIGALIALLALAGVILLLIVGPSIGIDLPQVASREQKTETFTAPMEGAESARLELDVNTYPTSLRTDPGDRLVTADMTYHGQAIFDVTGSTDKLVRIGMEDNVTFGLFTLGGNQRWDITLTDQVPWDIDIDGGSGSFEADLTDVDLRGLTADIGSGSFNLRLPETNDSYEVRLEGGSGSLNLDLPGQGDVEVRLDGASGSLNLSAPAGTAVRVEVLDGGSGSINVPGSMTKIEGDRSEDEGTWETDNYAGADSQLLIIVDDLGSGSFSLDL